MPSVREQRIHEAIVTYNRACDLQDQRLRKSEVKDFEPGGMPESLEQGQRDIVNAYLVLEEACGGAVPEHTEDVVGDLHGLDEADIEAMRRAKR